MIVEYFLRLDTHMDAEALHQIIRRDGHNLGIATIYRTLNLLREAGLVEQKSFADGRSVFEVNTPDEHHDHIVCLDCGLVVEFENEKIEALQRQVAESLNFRLESHRLDLFGHCTFRKCPRKKAAV